MLIGTGVDLIEIERIALSIERYGDRFLRRIYTDHEIAYCSRKRGSAESFAARFAAKEAAAKALALKEHATRPVTDTLSDYLASKKLLLVLDNADRALVAAA